MICEQRKKQICGICIYIYYMYTYIFFVFVLFVLCTYSCISIHMSVYMYICTYIYIYMYIYIFVYVYVRTSCLWMTKALGRFLRSNPVLRPCVQMPQAIAFERLKGPFHGPFI